MRTLAMKFGGASLGTATSLSRVLSIITAEYERWDRLLIVASALDGVTDMLLEAAQLARVGNRRGYRRIAANLRTRHMALIDQLPLGASDRSEVKADIDRLLYDMLDQCQTIADAQGDELSPSASDAVVAAGERLSARIIAALLRKNDIRGIAVDGADLLITDVAHGNANPILPLTQVQVDDILAPMLERGMVPVVTGFIGATASGATTTLGRGGTDYTASILSTMIKAQELWVWTDVDGMMSADPRVVQHARTIPALDYIEAAELAYFGARILHARMIEPIAKASLPLRIKNVSNPQGTGSLVEDPHSDARASIKAVTTILGLALTHASSGSLAGITKMVGNTFYKVFGIRNDVMIVSQSSNASFLCLVIPTSIGVDGVDRLQRALQAKMAEYPHKSPWETERVSLVTVIGNKLRQSPQMLAQILESLEDIAIKGIAAGPSDRSVTLVVSQADEFAALTRIHELITRSDSSSGPAPS